MRSLRGLLAAALGVVMIQAQAAPRWPAVDAVLATLVEHGELAGVVTLAARDGRVVHAAALGKRDLASGAPLTMETIFRAYSMTKPVTAVAMMILYEEGRWAPEDPITRVLPELAGLQVFRGVDAGGRPILAAPRSVPTLEQLLSHTAGFSYGFFPGYVDDQYRALQPFAVPDADAFIARLAQLPLAYEPGTRWQYSLSMDVQGAIIERLSGQRLADFMQARIFGPLHMRDTGFYVPAEKHARLATLYQWVDGRLAEGSTGRFAQRYAAPPGFASGGGGLVTTAGDFLRFGQMLLNGGTLDGVRILRPESVRLIMSNHLPAELVDGGFGIGMQQLRSGYQYGYNGVVVTDPQRAGVALGRGSYLWDGAAGTWFWVDPENHVVFVGMIQRLMEPGMPPVQQLAQRAVLQSLPRRRGRQELR